MSPTLWGRSQNIPRGICVTPLQVDPRRTGTHSITETGWPFTLTVETRKALPVVQFFWPCSGDSLMAGEIVNVVPEIFIQTQRQLPT